MGQFYNGFISRGLSIGTKIGAGFGALVGLADAIKTGNLSEI